MEGGTHRQAGVSLSGLFMTVSCCFHTL